MRRLPRQDRAGALAHAHDPRPPGDGGSLAGRRDFLRLALFAGSGLAFPSLLRAQSAKTVAFGAGELVLLGDGMMELPIDFVLPDSIPRAEREALLASGKIGPDTIAQPLNVTLWRTAGRTVLFDVGSGLQFLDGTGLLPDSLAAAGVDPSQITDVVFTHAHPDHLWGVLDDFGDLLFTEADYHINKAERDYWMADNTLGATPDALQTFVVGAQSRLPLLEDRLHVFGWGDEVLPGLEAVDTRGHTPGHTSFTLHEDNESLMVIGDALLNPVLSFEHAAWPSGSDQDPQAAVATRRALLDRLAGDSTRCVGYHLPAPGIGHVEREGRSWRWISEV